MQSQSENIQEPIDPEFLDLLSENQGLDLLYEDDEPDLYAVLGVSRSATEAEIRSAYRRLSLLLHPDKQEGTEEIAHKVFSRLSTAYKVVFDEPHSVIV
ncbi:DnaJ (Hsp40), subfamily C, member 11 [Cichlidogyrus casuarinus]|uniref:DnaJ (Hsp40), subfamily C, member 11 n=1 Tax=Cichlidogyrus casuarinus TaxID=1844966 RepID=A0ABD2Q098_9PLAT